MVHVDTNYEKSLSLARSFSEEGDVNKMNVQLKNAIRQLYQSHENYATSDFGTFMSRLSSEESVYRDVMDKDSLEPMYRQMSLEDVQGPTEFEQKIRELIDEVDLIRQSGYKKVGIEPPAFPQVRLGKRMIDINPLFNKR